MLKRYRSRAVEVLARELTHVEDFVTQSGTQVGQPGDFAITAYGETYPCPREVFLKKYEAV